METISDAAAENPATAHDLQHGSMGGSLSIITNPQMVSHIHYQHGRHNLFHQTIIFQCYNIFRLPVVVMMITMVES